MELKTLQDLFSQKLYRIPDYQRGYAWQKEQIEDFWLDLINLDDQGNNYHYMGVLTVKPVTEKELRDNNKWHEESWLLKNGYKIYYVIDGQQRLITSLILIQAIIEIVREFHKKQDLNNDDENEIYFCDKKLEDYEKQFIYEERPKRITQTYKLLYEKENPLANYLIYKIFGGDKKGRIDETYYTLNLSNAKKYFLEQLKFLISDNGISQIENEFRKLINKFKFILFEISQDFDENQAFESLNNRGKPLSCLEILKNRLIYLVQFYPDEELPPEDKIGLKNKINETWKEIYIQLGKNKNNPLNDDDFLRDHWIIYFDEVKKRGVKYNLSLLREHFAIENVMKKRPKPVKLEDIREEKKGELIEYEEENNEHCTNNERGYRLEPEEINKYTKSLMECVKIWYNTYFPKEDDFDGFKEDDDFKEDIVKWLMKLIRFPISYWRPLVMAILVNNEIENNEKVDLLKEIERFLFIAFCLNKNQSNWKRNDVYSEGYKVYKRKHRYNEIKEFIDSNLKIFFNKEKFKAEGFAKVIDENFQNKEGFYSWRGLKYFLYEYELELKPSNREEKLGWENFTKYERDKISIEHICPQEINNKYWKDRFGDFTEEERHYLINNLGNLLPLNLQINKSLGNDGFDDKKKCKVDKNGKIIRNGYENGSYSELEVSKKTEWTAKEIRERGLKLLKFMEERWGISLGEKKDKIKLLKLEFLKN